MDIMLIFLLILSFMVIYWLFFGEKIKKRMMGEKDLSLNHIKVLKQIYDQKKNEENGKQKNK